MSTIVYTSHNPMTNTLTNTFTIQYFVDEVEDLLSIDPEFYSLIEDNLTITDLSQEDKLHDDEVDEQYGVTVTFKKYDDMISFTSEYLEVDLGPNFKEKDLQNYIKEFTVN